MILALAVNSFSDLYSYLHRLWEGFMPQEYGDDRLIFDLHADDAIELDRLGDGFAGLARHFRRHLADSGIDPGDAPSKLFVTDVKAGSVEFELATLVGLYVYGTAAADGFVIWTEFYGRVQSTLDYLAGRAPRPKGYTRADAQDYDSFLRTIAGKRGAKLNVRRAKFHQKTSRRETLAEFDFNEQDVANAHMKLAVDTSDFEKNAEEPSSTTHRTENNVPFVWHRTDREKGKAVGQTSDRGIVAKIADKPLPVYFASEIENQKDKMTKMHENPFDLVYLIDVSVEYDQDDVPRSYTILSINQIIGGDSD